MNQLESGNINIIAEQAMGGDEEDIELHPSVIAYIKLLLEPYAQAITGASSDAIINWIPLAFPGNIANGLMGEIRDVNSHNFTGDRRERAIKRNIMDRLIHYLVTAGYRDMLRNINTSMNPWNILNGILKDDDLRTLFQYTPNMDKLPISVSINGTFYDFDMNMEQAMGLLLFGVTSGFNFQIYVFGQILTPDLTSSDPGNFYNKFVVVVGNQSYGFKTPDFMQGFQTGADWMGVDHHRYWSNLRQITRNNTGGYTETPITF